MKIAVGCDHGGLEHKNAIAEHLKSEGFEVEDFGIYENKSVDYPEIALKVANSIKNGENELGILVCGTGIGMSLAANKVNGIRAAACSEHFSALQESLAALNIPYAIDSGIVRGLDYYTKTVFEIISNRIGAQGTVCGGGRYDRLVETVGGPSMPGIGFGMGMERLMILLESYGKLPQETGRCDAFCIAMGDGKESLQLADDLRRAGIRADFDPLVRSMKAQMRYAEKLGARLVVIQGDEERQKGVVIVRNMSTREQTEVGRAGLVDRVLEMLKGGETNG